MKKKKRFFILLLTAVVMVTVMFLFGFNSKLVNKASHYDVTSYKSEKVPVERTVIIMGKEISLKYDCTVNDRDGTYDEYLDEDRNVYSFLQNSDILCSICYMKKTNESEALSDNEIREKAESYLKDVIGTDVFSQYTFVDQSEDQLLSYNYFIDCMMTNDMLYIAMDQYGNIDFFSVWNLGKYTGKSLDGYDIKKTESKAMEYLSQLNNMEIKEKYISMDSTGELQLTCGYSFTSESGVNSLDRCTVIMVKK